MTSSSNSFTPPEERLTLAEKEAIRGYFVKIALPTGVVATLLAFALGFFVNDVARGEAFRKAYSEALDDMTTSLATGAAEVATAQVAAEGARDSALAAARRVSAVIREAERDRGTVEQLIPRLQQLTDRAEPLVDQAYPEIARQLALNREALTMLLTTAGAVVEASIVLPRGAILAFAQSCPSGWSPFLDGIGRVIVGAGPPRNFDELNRPLSQRDIGNVGGEESHVLLLQEVTAHQHELFGEPGDAGVDAGRDMTLVGGVGVASGRRTATGDDRDYVLDRAPTDDIKFGLSAAAGGNPDGTTKAHNNMPSFIALSYCIKS